MSTRLRLSIALACYNGERYIGEQLDSIAHQTKQPDELVVYDDASVDATVAIVLDFARRATFPIRFFQNRERLGISRNFENAIRACDGDIVFLCDQDDVWYPDKITLIEARFINQPNVGAVFTNADVVDENLCPLEGQLWQAFKFSAREQVQVAAGDALGVLIKHPVVTGATMAFRSVYRDLILPIPGGWHDAWISLLIGATSYLDILSSPLMAYRQHDANHLGIPRRGRNRGKSCMAIYGPQAQRYEMARKRLLELVDHFPCSNHNMRRIDETLNFLHARATLPDTRWRRLPGALYELATLRYHRYAYGFHSLCKDLLR